MSKKKLLAAALAVFLLAGSLTAMAAAGADDPLISLSYVTGSYRAKLLEQASVAARESLLAVYNSALSAAQGGVRLLSFAKNDRQDFSTGMSLTLVSGKGRLSITRGAVVDVTTGDELADGAALTEGHRYLAAEDTKAQVTLTSAAVLALDGSPWEAPPLQRVFVDVPAGSWYYEDVYKAVSLGLVDGMSATAYEPLSSLTVAQAIKLAACLNQRHADGAVTLQNGAPNWYDSYVAYAVEKGLIRQGEYTSYNSPISRTEFVRIFYKALPADNYGQLNQVADGAIPDVKMGDPGAAEIYAFYRAGILTGDERNFFNPGTAIVRSEVAAILSRMNDETVRKLVSIT